MTDRVNAEKAVRRALETVIADAALQAAMRELLPPTIKSTEPYSGGKFPIWWPNQKFYSGKDQTKPPAFIRVSHHPAPPRARTVGANPRVMMTGHSIIGLFIPEGEGEDLIDNLANLVLAAYPYAASFVREGFDVRVVNPDPKGAFGSLGRWYKPIHINWDCWRAT